MFWCGVISNLDVLHACREHVLMNQGWLIVVLSAPETLLLQTVLGFYLSGIQYIILLTAFKYIKEREKKMEMKLNLKIHSVFFIECVNNVLSATVLPCKSQVLTFKCSLRWRSSCQKHCIIHCVCQYSPSTYHSSPF